MLSFSYHHIYYRIIFIINYCFINLQHFLFLLETHPLFFEQTASDILNFMEEGNKIDIMPLKHTDARPRQEALRSYFPVSVSQFTSDNHFTELIEIYFFFSEKLAMPKRASSNLNHEHKQF
ncbi:hypothetical protein ACJX0J_010489 [Zea mays]